MTCVSVAVPVPFLERLTYRVPDAVAPPVRGARVLVPLGSRVVTGIVTGVAADPPDSSPLRALLEVLDEEPFVPEDVLNLALWAAEYYACGAGDVIAAAMPPRAAVRSARQVAITDRGREWLAQQNAAEDASGRAAVLHALRSGRAMAASRLGTASTLRALEREGLVEISQPVQGRVAAHKTVRVASLTLAGHAALQDGAPPHLGARQREALATLAGSPDGIDLAALRTRGLAAATLSRLGTRGLVALRRDKVERDPFAAAVGGFLQRGPVEPSVLTPEQAAAVDRLTASATAGQFRVALLHGVTGSGKTAVYVRLARVVLELGRSVLVLVPEIALTPAIAALFRRAFGDRVAIQHSGLSDGERYDQWQRIRRGEIAVVVGTRSAVFAPMSRLGLIVVDEEHDSSFKQEEIPRYHGRDVAIVRGKEAEALVVLGSATPAVETYHNALRGRFDRLVMSRRVGDRPLAAVRIVGMREEYAAHGTDVVLSEVLATAIDDRLKRGEQALVLLNRRGLAAAVFCRQCAGTLECPNCSVSLTVHTERGLHRARCHYCNYSRLVPKACPQCAGPYLERAGFGTERVEAQVASRWPGARVARLDRDTARQRGAVARLLSQVAQGEIDVLVGTQMIAKGHDFPGVTLVGVISADVGLGLADFRAAERTFQLLTQVAGRAGRGDRPGEAVIQTLYPDHYSIRHACRQDYAAFFEEEIKYRRAMRYPPIVALVNAIVRAPTFAQALAEASDLAATLREAAGDRYQVLGPAPAPLARIRGEYRVQLVLKGAYRSAMRRALLDALAARTELRRRVTVDVDPLSVL